MLRSLICLLSSLLLFNVSFALFSSKEAPPPPADAPPMNQVTSLFSEEESPYLRYAAVLAATEPFRELRDARAKKALSPFKYWLIKTKKRNVCDVARIDPKGNNGALRAACSFHVTTVSKIAASLGFTIAEFNALSIEIGTDEELKDRVMKQAYLYRLASQVGNEVRSLPQNKLNLVEDNEQRPSSQLKIAPSRMKMFIDVSGQIERLRAEGAALLKSELEVDQLPPNMCSANMLPFLSERVQGLCKDFPEQAEEVCREAGMEVDEFNTLLERSRRNPLLRLRVNSKLRVAARTAKTH